MEVTASSRFSEDLPAREVPAGKESQPDSLCARQQMKSVLDMAIKTLPERYRKIVAMYYTKEMTMKDIGTTFGINESRVSQIHHAALLKLNAVLQSNGIQSSQAF
jgi:RNA polymerase sigma factor for flagellar operon FliA